MTTVGDARAGRQRDRRARQYRNDLLAKLRRERVRRRAGYMVGGRSGV